MAAYTMDIVAKFHVLLTRSETPQNYSEVDATWLAMSENKTKKTYKLRETIGLSSA